MATQNPIESEGTYELPEAQVDRFMLKVLIGYPTPNEEFIIVDRMARAVEVAQQVIDTEGLIELQRTAEAVFVDPALIEYAVRVVGASRDPALVGLGDLASYITYGTTQPTGIVCTREQIGGQDISQEPGGFSGGGGGGGGAVGRAGRFLVIEEPTLQKVADMTGGS